MPKWLTKEYGPFTGTVWIVVIVGGVGLGLVMRRYFNRGDAAGESAATSPTVAPTSSGEFAVAPAFSGTGTLFNQGEIVSEVLEAIKTQQPGGSTPPPPATTNPTNLLNIEKLRGDLARLIGQRTSVVATHENLKRQYAATPTTKPAKRAELYAEMEKYEALRRRLNEQIAGLQSQIKYYETRSSA